MKKTLLTLGLLLTPAAAQPVTPTTVTVTTVTQNTPPVQLPDLPELRRKVTVAVPMTGLSLDAALTLIARSSGLTILTQGLPTVQLRSGLGSMPAGDAIRTLLNLYAPGITAIVQNKLLIVGEANAINRVRGVMGSDMAAKDVRVINVPGLSPEQFSRIQSLLDGQSILFDTGRVILSGTPDQTAAAAKVLAGLPTVPQQAAAPEVVTKTYPVSTDLAQTAAAVQTLTGATVSTVGTTLLVKGTAAQQQQASTLLSSMNTAAPQRQTTLKRSYPSGTPQNDKAVIEALLDVKVTPLDAQRLIVVEGTEAQQKAVVTILDTQRMRRTQQAISYYPVNTGKAADLLPALRRELPDSDIQVIEGRNIISVQASAADQLRVAGILTTLQKAPETASTDELITRSIKLGYSEAAGLASSLSSLRLTSAPPVQGGTGTAGAGTAAITAQMPPLSIFADSRTNSVILTGPRAQVDEMSRAIANIDVPEKSIRVRLRVEQVNVNDIQNLGVNWKVGLGGASIGQQDGTLSVGYAPTIKPASVEVALNTAKTKGNNRTIIDANFAALSGQETNFQNGGELLFPAQTSVVNGATVNNPGQTYSYGLNIKVRPRIAPDGTVVMTMDTQLGSTPASGPQSSIQQTKQTMSSTVLLKQGETVVLGGILTNTMDQGSKGIPGLMDVPLLGSLFGTKTSTKTDTALLFVVSAEEINAALAPQVQNGTQRTDVPATPAPTTPTPVPAPVSQP